MGSLLAYAGQTEPRLTWPERKRSEIFPRNRHSKGWVEQQVRCPFVRSLA